VARGAATFRFEKRAISGGLRFSVFHPYMFARGRIPARRRKWLFALGVSVIRNGFFGGTAEKTNSAKRAQRTSLQLTQIIFSRQRGFVATGEGPGEKAEGKRRFRFRPSNVTSDSFASMVGCVRSSRGLALRSRHSDLGV
jgi:hypothetical protein